MPQGVSIHVGLNRVDPAHYGGWDGKLVACEFDANDMAELAGGKGFKTETLLTEAATAKALTSTIEKAAGQCDPHLRLSGQPDLSRRRQEWPLHPVASSSLEQRQVPRGYRLFRKRIAQKMPPWQSPNLFIAGKTDSKFASQHPFTV